MGKSRLGNRVSSLKARLEKIRNSNEISQHKFYIYFFKCIPFRDDFYNREKLPDLRLIFLITKIIIAWNIVLSLTSSTDAIDFI